MTEAKAERLLASSARGGGNVLETEFQGGRLVDVRIWYRDAEGALKPTRKGLAVRREEFGAFVELVQEALAELE